MPDSSITIREHFENMLEDRDVATRLAADEREKAASALREQLSDRIQAGDSNLREHIAAQISQLRQMVEHQEVLVSTRFQAAQTAIDKAEVATEKRFESVNEFRAQLSQVISGFLPREVADSQIDALSKRLSFLEAESRFEAGSRKGVGVSVGVLAGSLGALATIITIIIILANVLTKP